LKGNSDEAPSCFRLELKKDKLYIRQVFVIPNITTVAFNTFPLFLKISVDTKLNSNINSMTGHEDQKVCRRIALLSHETRHYM